MVVNLATNHLKQSNVKKNQLPISYKLYFTVKLL
jgi:hypothetical protein